VGFEPPDDLTSRSGYRLPTEFEWEHAVRAGTVTSRFFGTGTQHLTQYAWHATNAGSGTRPVGLLRPNPVGLFDVYGNISEWCHPLPNRSEDGIGMVRGGHYRSTPRFLRSAMPIPFELDAKVSVIGFRVVTRIDPVHVKPHERKEN
jgi:formylglycine-generating enzyme required for sulfatase activity